MICILILSAFVVGLSATVIVQRKLIKLAGVELLQALADKQEVLVKLDEQISRTRATESEGFLQFISQSRDWAFDYIENVQQSVKFFCDVSSTEITSSDNVEIVEAFYKLLEFLPEETENKENENE